MNSKYCLNCKKIYFKSIKISKHCWIRSKYCSRLCQNIFQSCEETEAAGEQKIHELTELTPLTKSMEAHHLKSLDSEFEQTRKFNSEIFNGLKNFIPFLTKINSHAHFRHSTAFCWSH